MKFLVPLNRDTEKLYTDRRMIIDAPVLTEPRTWIITKVNRISPNGIANITLAQDRFDEHLDYIEVNDVGNVVGMWADYYAEALQSQESGSAVITYAGLAPEIKIGGSYKKFTITFYDDAGSESEFREGTWSYTIDGNDASDLLEIKTSNDSSDLNNNQIKIKFTGDELYLNKTLTISYKSTDNIETSINAQIVSL